MSMQYVVKGKISRSIHDLKCLRCGKETFDEVVNPDKIPPCGSMIAICEQLAPCCGDREIRLDLSKRRQCKVDYHGIHPKDRAVVYVNPKTGKPAIPGQDTEFTRRKYEGWGYERREFETLRELDKFCKKEKLVNERANFDNGNGVK